MPSSVGSQHGHPCSSSSNLVACRCARGLSSSLLFNTTLPTRPGEGRAKKKQWAMLLKPIVREPVFLSAMYVLARAQTVSAGILDAYKSKHQRRLNWNSNSIPNFANKLSTQTKVQFQSLRKTSKKTLLPSIMPSSRSRWQACCHPSVKPCWWCFLSPSCRPSASPLLYSCCSRAYTASNRSSPSSPENKNLISTPCMAREPARPSKFGKSGSEG